MKKLVKGSEEIFGMARIGFAENLEVYVNTNDGGNIPHFHIRDKNNWDRFHSCIKLDEPEYFFHQGKEDVLNSQQRKALYEFMSSKVANPKYSSKFDNNWQLACFMWEINNSDAEIADDVEMPDYRNLPNKA